MAVASSSMELNKLPFSDHSVSPRYKAVVSRFGLGVFASFILLTLILFKTPFFNSSAPYSTSPNSWHFPLSSVNNDTTDIQIGGIREPINENHTIAEIDEKGVSLADRHIMGDENGTVADMKLGNGSSIGILNVTIGKVEERKNNTVEITSLNANHSEIRKGGDRLYEECDLFDGRWVRDETKPYYPPGSCPFVDRDFDCHLNQRPDDGFLRWKWQPYHCDLPRYVFLFLILYPFN